jgi:hypothetical protein
MDSSRFRSKFVLLVLLCCWLAAAPSSQLRAQMTAVVNSLADDEDAYAFDNPDTEDIDESVDGICGDAKGRCTLRAALYEAWNLEVPAHVTFSVTGTIVVDSLLGYLQPPSGSLIEGHDQQVTIRGQGSYPFLMQLEDNTTIKGLVFRKAWDAIDVMGKFNQIGGNRETEGNLFLGMEQNAILLAGDSNLVIGNKIGIGGDGDAIYLSPNGDTSYNKYGIFVTGSNNIIGGNASVDGNTISRNLIGISMIGTEDPSGAACNANAIQGNKIGTDYEGNAGKSNGYGIETLYGGDHLIGGLTEDKRNIISGNREAGILIGTGTHDADIAGNTIGLNVSRVGLGNKHGIILAQGSTSCNVSNNLIDANAEYGIEIAGGHAGLNFPSTDHRINGNEIMFNGLGIIVAEQATGNVIGSSLTFNAAPNQIQLNAQGGVLITSSTPTPNEARTNTLRKNAFLDNGGTEGITVRNSQDGILAPTIMSYYEVINTAQAIVTGTHHRPGSLIDLYTGERQTTTHYEGKRWLGAGFVQNDQTFSISIAPCNCHHLVATATDQAGNTSEFSSGEFPVTDVREEHLGLPAKFFLGDAYPNPFNPSTTIEFGIVKPGFVSLKTYDVLGQEVATLVNEQLQPGTYQRAWNASNMPSGVYYYRLVAGSFVDTKKMILLR